MDDPIAINIYIKAEMAAEKVPFTGYIKLSNKAKIIKKEGHKPLLIY